MSTISGPNPLRSNGSCPAVAAITTLEDEALDAVWAENTKNSVKRPNSSSQTLAEKENTLLSGRSSSGALTCNGGDGRGVDTSGTNVKLNAIGGHAPSTPSVKVIAIGIIAVCVVNSLPMALWPVCVINPSWPYVSLIHHGRYVSLIHRVAVRMPLCSGRSITRRSFLETRRTKIHGQKSSSGDCCQIALRLFWADARTCASLRIQIYPRTEDVVHRLRPP